MLEKTLQLQNNLGEVERLLDELGNCCAQLNGGPNSSRELLVAVEELFVNIINYAFPAGETHEITVQVEGKERQIKVTLTDNGREFNPLDAPTPDLDAPLDQREPGGLGVFLSRRLVDKFEYQRKAGQNVVSVTKSLAAQ